MHDLWPAPSPSSRRRTTSRRWRGGGRRRSIVRHTQVLAAMKLVLALLGAAAAFAPQTAPRASTSLAVGPVGEQKLTTKGPSSKHSMDNQFALGWMGKYDDAATEDERSKKFLARHDEQVGAEPGSLQVRTPERVAAEIAQLKADRQARVRRAKKLN